MGPLVGEHQVLVVLILVLLIHAFMVMSKSDASFLLGFSSVYVACLCSHQFVHLSSLLKPLNLNSPHLQLPLVVVPSLLHVC